MAGHRVPLWVGALLVVIPAEVVAQADTVQRRDTTVYSVEGITIQARRPVTTVGGASAVEVSVASLGLSAAPSAEELLREIPALHVRTNSRGQAEISVRGSESRQVAILLDGVPLTLGWDGRTDLSVLPATAVEEIGFVRGLSTILHGPNVLGGVVEMSLARLDNLPAEGSTSASAGLDELGGYGLSATLSQPFTTDGGHGLIRVGAGYRDTPGMPLADGIVEPVPTEDNLRLNTDVDNLDGFVALRYIKDGGAWGSFSGVAHRGERGIAAELGAESPRLWRYPHVSRAILALSGGTGDRATPLGRGDLESSVGVDFGRTEIRSFGSRAYDDVVGTEDGDDRTVNVRLLGDHTLGQRGALRGSATFAAISHDETVDGLDASYRQNLFSLGGETVWRLLDDSEGTVEGLRLSVGAAYDRGSTPETGGLESLGTLHDWGARAGLSALANDGSTVVHAGVSRRGRFPSLREVYSEALNRFAPNPDLSPEHLLAFEGGVTTRVGNGEVQVVGFRHDLSDAIRRITLEDGRRQRVNSDELTSIGVEFFISQSMGPLELGGDLTLQSVTLTDPGTATSTEPENVPEQVGRAWARYALGWQTRIHAEAEYAGSQFCQDPDTGQDVELDDGTWWNAAISKVWSLSGSGRAKRLEARISGDNLTGALLFDQCGLPRPGRLLRFQIRVF